MNDLKHSKKLECCNVNQFIAEEILYNNNISSSNFKVDVIDRNLIVLLDCSVLFWLIWSRKIKREIKKAVSFEMNLIFYREKIKND